MQRHKMKKAMLILLFVLLTVPSQGQMRSRSGSPCQLLFSPAFEQGEDIPYLTIHAVGSEFTAEDIMVWIGAEESIEPDTVTHTLDSDVYELRYFDEELNMPGRGVNVEWQHEEHPFHLRYAPAALQRKFMLAYSCPQSEDSSS